MVRTSELAIMSTESLCFSKAPKTRERKPYEPSMRVEVMSITQMFDWVRGRGRVRARARARGRGRGRGRGRVRARVMVS